MAELQLNASGNASEGREGIHYISSHSDDKKMKRSATQSNIDQ
jgi:hypothetical protein